MSFACIAYRLRCTPYSEYSAYYCPVNVPKWICFGEIRSQNCSRAHTTGIYVLMDSPSINVREKKKQLNI